MSIPSTEQLLKMQDPKQATKLYLSVYQPSTVLAGRVNNAVIAKGERLLDYDTVTAGSYQLVQSGMTMYVGTTLGGFDKGKIRVRSASSTVITVAENSHINWADGDYLTIVSFFEINPVYPRIIQDPADAEQTLWYKDYDIAYTNQNTVLGTFICMGSHYAGFIGDDVYYTSSGTYNLKSEALTYYWTFEGATVTGSNSSDPRYMTYNTPGHYTTTLVVSGTSSSDVSYRHVSIYNRPEVGTSVPVLSWELVDLTGSRGQGGYSCGIRVRQTIPETQLKDGSLVVVFSDDWYGDMTTRYSLGGNAANRGSIFFVGYVISGSIVYNYRDSYVEFEVGSPTEIMKLAEGFSISVRDGDPTVLTEDDPSGWVVLLDMDLRRAVYHYLRWHSTVLLCNDFSFRGTDRALQYFDADRTSLYDAINTIITGAWLGKVVSDRQGRIWAERDIWLEPVTYNWSFTVVKQDWIGDPAIEESNQKVSYLEMGGVDYDRTSYTPVLAAAPGTTPGYRGKIERIQGLALVDQAELNQIVGDLFAHLNLKYPFVEMSMAGSYRCLDIAPQEKHYITIDAGDTARGIVFATEIFIPETLRYVYKGNEESLLAAVTYQHIGSGEDGDTVTIPVNPVQEEGEYSVPPVNLPPIYFPPLPVIIGGGSIGASNFIAPRYTITIPVGGGPGVDAYDFAQSGVSLPGETSCNYIYVRTHYAMLPAGSYTIYPILKYNNDSGGTTSVFDGIVNVSPIGAGAPSSTSIPTTTITVADTAYAREETLLSVTFTLSVKSVIAIQLRRWSNHANDNIPDDSHYFYGFSIYEN
jgi:hypothetical protein